MHHILLAIVLIVICLGPVAVCRALAGLAVVLAIGFGLLCFSSWSFEHSPEHIADVARCQAARAQQEKQEADPAYQRQRAIDKSLFDPIYVGNHEDFAKLYIGQWYYDLRSSGALYHVQKVSNQDPHANINLH
jgi:hypothetical protein